MQTIGPDKSYIDYFQGVCASQERSNRFGVRVRTGVCLAVVKNGDGQPVSFGEEYLLPLRLETLPSHLRMVVDNHVLNYPASDLIEVMIGKKTFQQALESLPKREPKPTTTDRTERLPNTSEQVFKRKSVA